MELKHWSNTSGSKSNLFENSIACFEVELFDKMELKIGRKNYFLISYMLYRLASRVGQVGWDRAGQGGTGRGRAGQGGAGQGGAGQGRAGAGQAGQAGQGRARQGKAGQGRARQGKAGQGRARQGKAGQGRARQGRAGQGRAGQGRAGRGRQGGTGEGENVSTHLFITELISLHLLRQQFLRHLNFVILLSTFLMLSTFLCDPVGQACFLPVLLYVHTLRQFVHLIKREDCLWLLLNGSILDRGPRIF